MPAKAVIKKPSAAPSPKKGRPSAVASPPAKGGFFANGKPRKSVAAASPAKSQRGQQSVLKRPARASEEEDDEDESMEAPATEEREEEEEVQERHTARTPQPKTPRASLAAATPRASTGGRASRVASPAMIASGQLRVRYAAKGATASPLAEGLVEFRRSGQLCDVVLVAAGGARFPVHRLVLSAQSMVLEQKLRAGAAELSLPGASQEGADLLAKWLYGEIDAATYKPSSSKVNEEMLRISSDLGLPRLSEICALHLARHADVGSVVPSVQLCEEYGLPDLRAALIVALVEDRSALDIVSRDPATMGHPALMRELLAALAGGSH